MSRTGKRGGGSLGGGPSQMMRMGKIDSGSMGSGPELMMWMGKRGGGSNESMKNVMMRMRNISRFSGNDGKNQFILRLGKRGGHLRIMKRESNWERMMKRDGGSWGRIL